MKYKCLVLDHDDTTVDSSRIVHYPSFLEIMKTLRPDSPLCSYEDFMKYSSTPGAGLIQFFMNELKFTAEDINWEKQFWLNFAKNVSPHFYPGMKDIIQRQKAAGGFVCVISQSVREFILRDYATADVSVPDLIYSLEKDLSRCKPNPYPLLEVLRITGCKPEETLVVDDMIHGLKMAHSCGVDFAAAEWAYRIPDLQDVMEAESDYVLRSTNELEKLLFG